MTGPDVLADLDRALASTEVIVAGIHAGQWPAPTPCTELDVRDVVNHLVSGNRLFAALVHGGPLPDRGEDPLDGDPLASFQQAAGELREAFAAAGVLASVYTAPFGSGPGAALAHVRIVELLMPDGIWRALPGSRRTSPPTWLSGHLPQPGGSSRHDR